jgi:chromosome segregation ATPase
LSMNPVAWGLKYQPTNRERSVNLETPKPTTYAEALARGEADQWFPEHPFRDAIWTKEKDVTDISEEAVTQTIDQVKFEAVNSEIDKVLEGRISDQLRAIRAALTEAEARVAELEADLAEARTFVEAAQEAMPPRGNVLRNHMEKRRKSKEQKRAIVRRALERAANEWLNCRVEGGHALAALEVMASRISALADDPEEIRKIVEGE